MDFQSGTPDAQLKNEKISMWLRKLERVISGFPNLADADREGWQITATPYTNRDGICRYDPTYTHRTLGTFRSIKKIKETLARREACAVETRAASHAGRPIKRLRPEDDDSESLDSGFEEMEELCSRYQALRRANAALQEQLDEARQGERRLRTDVTCLRSELAAAQEELQELKVELDFADHIIAEVDDDPDEAREHATSLEAELDTIRRTAMPAIMASKGTTLPPSTDIATLRQLMADARQFDVTWKTYMAGLQGSLAAAEISASGGEDAAAALSVSTVAELQELKWDMFWFSKDPTPIGETVETLARAADALLPSLGALVARAEACKDMLCDVVAVAKHVQAKKAAASTSSPLCVVCTHGAMRPRPLRARV